MNIFSKKIRTEKSAMENIRDLKPEEIAALHNECVNFMLENHPEEFDKIITTENLIAEVGWFSDYLFERLPELKYSILNVKAGLIKKLNEYGDNENDRSRYFMIVFSEEDFKKELEKSNYSSQLIEDISLLHRYLLQGKESSEMAEEQWNLILNTNYGELDNYAVSCMETIGKKSSEIWADFSFVSKAAGTCPPNGMTCEEWVIACDAMGGLIGLIFGGAGSVLTGALLSYAASHECEDCDQPNK